MNCSVCMCVGGWTWVKACLCSYRVWGGVRPGTGRQLAEAQADWGFRQKEDRVQEDSVALGARTPQREAWLLSDLWMQKTGIRSSGWTDSVWLDVGGDEHSRIHSQVGPVAWKARLRTESLFQGPQCYVAGQWWTLVLFFLFIVVKCIWHKSYILTILSLQFCGIKYIYMVVHSSPLAISRTYLPQLKLLVC